MFLNSCLVNFKISQISFSFHCFIVYCHDNSIFAFWRSSLIVWNLSVKTTYTNSHRDKTWPPTPNNLSFPKLNDNFTSVSKSFANNESILITKYKQSSRPLNMISIFADIICFRWPRWYKQRHSTLSNYTAVNLLELWSNRCNRNLLNRQIWLLIMKPDASGFFVLCMRHQLIGTRTQSILTFDSLEIFTHSEHNKKTTLFGQFQFPAKLYE